MNTDKMVYEASLVGYYLGESSDSFAFHKVCFKKLIYKSSKYGDLDLLSDEYFDDLNEESNIIYENYEFIKNFNLISDRFEYELYDDIEFKNGKYCYKENNIIRIEKSSFMTSIVFTKTDKNNSRTEFELKDLEDFSNFIRKLKKESRIDDEVCSVINYYCT
jgi:hypothetical protein